MKPFIAILALLTLTTLAYAGDQPVAPAVTGPTIQERVTVTERVIPFTPQAYAAPAVPQFMPYATDPGCSCGATANFATRSTFASSSYSLAPRVASGFATGYATSYADAGCGASILPAFRTRTAFSSYGVGSLGVAGGCGGVAPAFNTAFDPYFNARFRGRVSGGYGVGGFGVPFFGGGFNNFAFNRGIGVHVGGVGVRVGGIGHFAHIGHHVRF